MPKYKYGSEIIPWESFEDGYIPTDEEKREARKKAKLAARNNVWNETKQSSSILDELEEKPMIEDLPF